MKQTVLVGSRRVTLTPQKALGTGGEADVYRLGHDEAVKIWKTEVHPDFVGLPDVSQAVRQRLDLLQTKMRCYPSGLPPRVVTPIKLAMDLRGRRIVGFTMRRVRDAVEIARLAERSYRASGVSVDRVREVLLDLRRTVNALHRAGVIIGDFNDLNVLVRENEAWLIDADSLQISGHPCLVYTERFLDPLLTDGVTGRPTLDHPYGESSDWYAFTWIIESTGDQRRQPAERTLFDLSRGSDDLFRRAPDPRSAEEHLVDPHTARVGHGDPRWAGVEPLRQGEHRRPPRRHSAAGPIARAQGLHLARLHGAGGD